MKFGVSHRCLTSDFSERHSRVAAVGEHNLIMFGSPAPAKP